MEMLNLAAAALFKTLENHNVDKSLLLEGTGLKMEFMEDPHKKHTWEQFVIMYDNCAKHIGAEQTVKEIAYQGIYNEKINLITRIATSLLSAKTLYWYVATFVAKHLFKESVVFTYTKVKSNHVKMVIQIDPELNDCPLLLETYKYLFEILPNLLGLPKSKVVMVLTERRAEFDIYIKYTSYFKLVFINFAKMLKGDESTIEMMELLENQSIQLSKVIEEKSQLLRIVSHDIANQVSIIDFYLKKVMKNEELSTEDYKFLSIANNSSGKLYNILKNVQNLEVSSVRGINLVPVDIEAVFLSVADNFHQQLKHKNLSLKCRSALDYNVMALAEATSLETNVLGNLLANAIKFSPEGSQIEIRARQEGSKILISVIDQGAGISSEDRKNIFTKKIRKSSVGTKGETGTGFGLGIVMNYINLYGGKIKVEPNEPTGSIFIIELDSYVPQIMISDGKKEIKATELNS